MNNAKRKPRAYIYTLGCRVNQYESAAVAAELKKYGINGPLLPTESTAEGIIQKILSDK